MNDTTSQMPLASCYDGWEAFHRLLVKAVAPLMPDQLAMRVAPNQRTVAEIAGHIVSARARWFNETLQVGDTTIERFYAWDADTPPTLNAAELELGLEKTWRLIASGLRTWTVAELADVVTTHHGDQRTRQWVIWHVLEHDLYHGGELSLTLGSFGLPGIDL